MHVVVWAWHNGRFPTMQIDHINGNGFDNHIENLREVSGSENKKNTLYPWKPNADTGLPGVCIDHNSYQIEVGHRQYYFRDKYEAFCHLTLLGRRYKEN
ncbi:MAG: HNH endonuclease [Prevotella sp.]|nr:HNH endonuclease [Prevotella sp.]